MNSTHTVAHATFTLERRYDAEIAEVFRAWADPSAKARWFASGPAHHELDFRVGGRETVRVPHEGAVLRFESVYHDIVADRRIVYSSVLCRDDTVSTVSITTVELVPDGEGTQLVLTEQGTFLDGHELPAWREEGTRSQLEAIAGVLGA